MTRLIMYVELHWALAELNEQSQESFSSFFAEYIDDVTGSYIMAGCVLIIISTFYFSNIYIAR